jgi:cyclopropane fatty-acyl-phospholipid synthase-like methyltransferase
MGRIPGLPNHLGGHGFVTHTDVGLIKFARDELNCKSMLDIGCGVGGQVFEAINQGLDARGVDGDFVTKREKPELFLIHDFTQGKVKDFNMKFDMIWCCEFVEHVAKEYEDNWVSLMQSGKYIFVTYSEPGKPGHHHVNCEPLEYWIELYKRYGFTLRQDLTEQSKTKSTMKREFWKDNGLIFENDKF